MRWTAFEISYTTIEIIIGVISLIGNGFILYIFAKEKKLRKKRNFYLMSLTFSDILLVTLGIPTTVLARFGLPTNPRNCVLSLCIVGTSRILPIYSIAAISIDRLQAVLTPIAYRNDTSTFSTLFTIFKFWTFVLTIGLLPYYGWNLGDKSEKCLFYLKLGNDFIRFYTIVGILLPLITIIVTYSIIIYKIRQISKNLTANKSASLKRSGLAQRREVRATIRISFIVATYVLCEIPIIVVNILNTTSEKGLVTDENIVHSFLALAHVHSAMNPFLYAFNIKEFKKACSKVLKPGKTEPSTIRSSSC